jgi:cation/acetate symporter
VTVAAAAIGALGVRMARTTSDLFIASRSVGPLWNASAISGEYLSAASFLGIAGLVMKYGVDMLWYPVGYAAGYLFLLVLVAAPLRRFGAYTIPDFAEGRLNSVGLRRIATAVVLLIGWFYILPQLKGAGVTLGVLVGGPYWVGVVVVGVVVTANVLGGMRGVTFVQAFQYWVKIVAISLPAFVLLGHYQAAGRPALTSPAPPSFAAATKVHIDVAVRFRVVADTSVDATGELDGRTVHGSTLLTAGQHRAAKGTELTFPAGAAAPHVAGLAATTGLRWSRPLGPIGKDRGHALLFVYSLMLATFLGTMGLPHILVRFYTNPDGRAARQTTLVVLVLLGFFYVFPAVYGALGRLYAPDLYLSGNTDAVVLILPGRVIAGFGGQLLAGLVAAGAFAAFMSTSSGLLISLASAISQDVLRGTARDFRIAAAVAGLVAIVLGLQVGGFDINVLVGWAFAIAASSFCPLLVLGIWWRGLTAWGAGAGLVVGAGLASVAIVLAMAHVGGNGWLGTLLTSPAAWTVPLAFGTMVVVSKLTADRVPADVTAKMIALHSPERLGLGRAFRA